MEMKKNKQKITPNASLTNQVKFLSTPIRGLLREKYNKRK